MKIQILLRSESWMETAGARIRYRRLQDEIRNLGCALAIDPITSVREGLKLNSDVYLFSKCQDAGALMLAEMLREAGALVGFDIFDDYLSNQSSATFERREFQRSLHGRVDFFLCSTERMRKVVRSFDETVPVHLLNDPQSGMSRANLTEVLDRKADQAIDKGRIDVLWFGLGNNPLFPVGLNDLSGLAEALDPLADSGFDVRLKVLTNADALDADGLNILRRLPFATEVEEWTAQREMSCLDDALVAFLPVNYQAFSTAKSLNRAITALTGGVQVLAAGYPLYAALDPFLYTSASALVDDLQSNSLKLRPGTIPSFEACLTGLADPAVEARNLFEFLCALPQSVAEVPVDRRPLRSILHGASSAPSVHSLGKSMGWLSLASPMMQQSIPVDAHLGDFNSNAFNQIRLRREALPRLLDAFQGKTLPNKDPSSAEYPYLLKLPEIEASGYLERLPPCHLATKAGRMVHYDSVMTASEAIYRAVFGEMVLMRSEREMPLSSLASLPGSAK